MTEEISTWGGARAGAGRKKGVPIKPAEERRTEKIVVTMTADQKRRITEKAVAAGLSASTYLLTLALSDQA